MSGTTCRASLVAALQRRLDAMVRADFAAAAPARLPTGCAAFDRFLPGGGFRAGTLVEWLAAEPGCGATSVALICARQACRSAGALVVVDRAGRFYPPAAARLGIDLDRLVLVRPDSAADHAWAVDQALRCPGVAVTLTWPESPGRPCDGRTLRRWQLAAERGGGLGMLIRPATARGEPSWAELRLGVEPLEPNLSRRRLRIRLVRCRGAAGGGSIELEIDENGDEAHLVCTVSRHDSAPGAVVAGDGRVVPPVQPHDRSRTRRGA